MTTESTSKASYIFSCNYAVTGKNDMISATEIFDYLDGDQVPLIHSFFVVGKIKISDPVTLENKILEISLIDPDGKGRESVKYPLAYQEKDRIININVGFPMIPIEKLGEYKIRLSLKGETFHEGVLFEVKQR